MVSKTQKQILNPNRKESSPVKNEEEEIENFCDENFSMLQKIHSILLNCSNMTQKQKREFCQSERFFMKQYLQKLVDERQG